MNQLVDGWDGVTRKRMLQTALTHRIDAEDIPVVGNQLQQALAFLNPLETSVTNLIENEPQITATTFQDALYDALGPTGLNWLVNLVPGGTNAEDRADVQLV